MRPKPLNYKTIIFLMADELQLQYNTPQDKLLVMLLERISALEDKHNKLVQTIEKLSTCVTICIETKRTSCNGPFSTTLGFVKSIIKEVFPQCTLYIERSLILYQSNISTILYLVFKTPVSLDTVKQSLHYRLFQYIDIHEWMTLTESDMQSLLQSRIREY